MSNLDSNTMIALVAIMAVALIALVAYVGYQRSQTHRLQHRFGGEYHRMLERFGSRGKAEAELKQREKRVEKMHLIALSSADAARFHNDWNAIQSRFVDNPGEVMAEADRLVRELMLKRGYPMTDFERRAADISVDHPAVVEHYRAAHGIAQRASAGQADTEALRQAVVHYRALFDELLAVR